MLENKMCSKCNQILPINNFYTRNDSASGYASQCKKCESIRRARPLSELRVKGARLNTETHKWCPSCNILLEKDKFYKNKIQPSGLTSVCKSCKNKKEKEKRNNNSTYKLRTNISRAIRKMLKGNQKSSSCMSHLPFTLSQLKQHLEYHFDENMNWQNYGSYWHVDHIYPHSLLQYDSMEHENFAKAWDLKNLRPLEKMENIKKSNKIICDIINKKIRN